MSKTSFSLQLLFRARIAFVMTLSSVAAGLFWFWSQRPDTDALVGQAYDAIQKSDFNSARRTLRELHQHDPENADVVEWLAEVCLNAGDESAAIDWLVQIPDTSPQRAAKGAFRSAQLSMKSNQPASARQCIDRCLRLAPDHEPGRRLLIHLELILTRWEAMLAQITELDRRGQATPADVALFCVGRNFNWEDDSHLEWLQGCVAKTPGDCLARTALAYYYSLQSQRDQAATLLQSSDVRQTEFESWRITLGMIEDHIDQDHIHQAHEGLSRMPPEADTTLRTWLAYGRIFAAQNKIERAIVAFENASRLSPFDPEPISAMSRLLTRQKRHDEASQWAIRTQLNSQLWQILSHAKPLAPQGPSAKTVMRMGWFLKTLGRHREAIICFESLFNHLEFGDEAKQLAELTRQATDEPRYLEVVQVHDLDRSISVAGPQSETAAWEAIEEGQHGPASETTIEMQDIAAQVGLEFTFFRGDAGEDFLAETLGGGVGVIDFDMDDWPDVVLTQGTSLPVSPQGPYSNRLFRNINGTLAVDVTAETGLSHGGYGQGCAVGDINNDGFPDLLVCNHGENVLYHNNGDGTFRDVTSEAGLQGQQWSTSASFADFDGDGDLDLYSVNYVRIPEGDLKQCRMGNYVGPCRVMDHPAEQDIFWINQGAGTFQDRTDSVGIQAADGKGLGVISADFDDDGWVDLFVGNDTTGNFLFKNLGTETAPAEGAESEWHGFQEIGVLAGVAFNRDGKGEACMGIACEDLNHDGLFDVFVTNYEKETNTFYSNLGNLGFTDQTNRLNLANASRPMLGWGAQFIDLDADGNRDLFVTNGDLYDRPMRSQLFLNRSGQFKDISDRAGKFFEAERFGRSAAIIDWNRDLAADLAVSFLKSPVALLTNNLPRGNRLSIRLIGVASARDSQGARLSATAGQRVTHFRSSSDGGYFASNENDVKIGLGPHDHIETLEVKWPSGRIQTWSQLSAGRKYALIEGRHRPQALQ
jgi:thioredoxin-like negative regulator of GroEL